VIALEAECLTKDFGTGDSRVRVVSEVSLEVREGEVLVLLGPSGSGKTTLLSMLGGLLRPTSGSVRVAGKALDAGTGAADVRLRRVGFVFQSFNLLPALSTVDNVALPLRLRGMGRREARGRAASTLGRLGLGDRAETRPATLSGGEKQRVSIARALVGEPSVVLADEPTASLDTARGLEAIDLLTGLAREGRQACVIVTHDHRLVRFADEVRELADGRLRAPGRVPSLE
jgi:putative ABC transport system ATP-binding protein